MYIYIYILNVFKKPVGYQKNGCPFASFFRPILKKKGRPIECRHRPSWIHSIYIYIYVYIICTPRLNQTCNFLICFFLGWIQSPVGQSAKKNPSQLPNEPFSDQLMRLAFDNSWCWQHIITPFGQHDVKKNRGFIWSRWSKNLKPLFIYIPFTPPNDKPGTQEWCCWRWVSFFNKVSFRFHGSWKGGVILFIYPED